MLCDFVQGENMLSILFVEILEIRGQFVGDVLLVGEKSHGEKGQRKFGIDRGSGFIDCRNFTDGEIEFTHEILCENQIHHRID